jgi:glycerophosphoryl diester phosphodiesterase
MMVFLPSEIVRGEPPQPDRITTSARHTIDTRTPGELRKLFRYSHDRLPIVSAHRGGGAEPGYPENCLATFERTLQHGFAMLEIDPRLTKDGTLVVHHDATLERTTNGTGRLVDKSLDEIRAVKLKDAMGSVTEFQVPTLDEVLVWAKGKTILVLDQKDAPLMSRIEAIERHQAEAYTMLIVTKFSDVQACYRRNPNIMMEVMIPNQQKVEEFDRLGVPWENVIAFVGHQPPTDEQLYRLIHERGARCMVGTSRNIDREWLAAPNQPIGSFEDSYRKLMERGADILETDIPVQISPLLYADHSLALEFGDTLHIRPSAP